ncbi:MAG: hypothetical protein ACP5OC_00320 [Thermoplasmata archaeon]
MPDKNNIIDTFPNFIRFWMDKLASSPDIQVELWESFYSNEDEEVFKKVIKNYSDDGVEWKEVAKKMIFPINSEKINRMNGAHINLLKALSELYHIQKQRSYFHQILRL